MKEREQRRILKMPGMKEMWRCAVALAILAIVPLAFSMQQGEKERGNKNPAPCKLRIEVKAGEKSVPVDNASVYVKFNDPHSNKMVEMNLKTNRDGVAHSPELQTRKVLVQVIAPGWKTYGRWHDTTEGEQTIEIHLEKPPKWY
jgi:hypothetical protein